eukprot:69702_1
MYVLHCIFRTLQKCPQFNDVCFTAILLLDGDMIILTEGQKGYLSATFLYQSKIVHHSECRLQAHMQQWHCLLHLSMVVIKEGSDKLTGWTTRLQKSMQPCELSSFVGTSKAVTEGHHQAHVAISQ